MLMTKLGTPEERVVTGNAVKLAVRNVRKSFRIRGRRETEDRIPNVLGTAITGLGTLIVKYGNRYDTASMFVPILALMVLGILLTSLVRRAEEQFAPWRMADD